MVKAGAVPSAVVGSQGGHGGRGFSRDGLHLCSTNCSTCLNSGHKRWSGPSSNGWRLALAVGKPNRKTMRLFLEDKPYCSWVSWHHQITSPGSSCFFCSKIMFTDWMGTVVIRTIQRDEHHLLQWRCSGSYGHKRTLSTGRMDFFHMPTTVLFPLTGTYSDTTFPFCSYLLVYFFSCNHIYTYIYTYVQCIHTNHCMLYTCIVIITEEDHQMVPQWNVSIVACMYIHVQ